MTPFERAREAMEKIEEAAGKSNSLNQADARLIIQETIGEAILEDRSIREELPTGTEQILIQILESTEQSILFHMGVQADVTSHALYALMRIAIRKGIELGTLQEREACGTLCDNEATYSQMELNHFPGDNGPDPAVKFDKQSRAVAYRNAANMIRARSQSLNTERYNGSQPTIHEGEGTDLKTALSNIRDSIEPGMQQLVDRLIETAGEGKSDA